MIEKYFKRLYLRTMDKSYALAHKAIADSLKKGGKCLDCGAHRGTKFPILNSMAGLSKENYVGIEWNQGLADEAKEQGLNVIQGDLNQSLEFADESFQCVFGLSVLEHLLYPCRYLRESYRVLEKDGYLIILTPNISTFFTAFLILFGKMPSSGPHPDSDQLLAHEDIINNPHGAHRDTETDTPAHRHLVVFSYRVLMSYMKMLGFRDIQGYGFGLYPFPNFLQPLLEKVDPYHCHQMVIIARK
jgi:SAM-dependent methyltransferase